MTYNLEWREFMKKGLALDFRNIPMKKKLFVLNIQSGNNNNNNIAFCPKQVGVG
jgi:hypothetical protein